MNFICDVHISYKLKNFLNNEGYTAIHINEILEGSDTNDIAICSYADAYDYIRITKDFDFLDFYHVRKSPKKVVKLTLVIFPQKN